MKLYLAYLKSGKYYVPAFFERSIDAAQPTQFKKVNREASIRFLLEEEKEYVKQEVKVSLYYKILNAAGNIPFAENIEMGPYGGSREVNTQYAIQLLDGIFTLSIENNFKIDKNSLEKALNGLLKNKALSEGQVSKYLEKFDIQPTLEEQFQQKASTYQ